MAQTQHLTEELQAKEASLKEILAGYGKVSVAFSGGVDSTLLLDVAHEVLGDDALAFTAIFACNPKREQQLARSFCAEYDICQIELSFDEFAVEGFADNPPNRCYICKRELLGSLIAASAERTSAPAALSGASAVAQKPAVLVEGSNLDDDLDYRPGAAAIKELGVASPLKQAGLTKQDIRDLARARGLTVWNKPACACLATRLPFGATLTPELIGRIDRAEEFVLGLGVEQVRVRVHGDLARIETDVASIPLLMKKQEQIDQYLHELGFADVVIDPQGYKTGSMNTAKQ